MYFSEIERLDIALVSNMKLAEFLFVSELSHSHVKKQYISPKLRT